MEKLVKRNVSIGLKRKMYEFIRDIGPEHFYIRKCMNYTMSLEDVKNEIHSIKYRMKIDTMEHLKENISILEDDIEELLFYGDGSKESTNLVNENKEKIECLLKRIDFMSKF